MDRDDLKDEIKRRADLAAIVGQYVPLQRAGRRLKARCPFHTEKTPSFFVDPAGGFWKCFGCGAGGDVFSFLQKIEGLSFPEAAERLARQLGLEWHPTAADSARADRRRQMQRALDLAAQYFEARLRSPAGAVAREYLQGRGLREETIAEFRLGYALPAWDDLARYLSSKNVAAEVAREADLIRPRQSGGYYDTFRNRIIFPIEDTSRHVIGFGGRTLDPEESAKYLNSADTPVFKKGRQVYGLPQARQAMTEVGYVVLVEGYTDVLALSQAGFRPVVAALGTALTEDHVRLLSRYVETVVLCYDADSAGQQAALRNLEVFERMGVNAQVVVLPGGTDPDSFVREQGLQAWHELLQTRLSLAEYQLEMIFSRYRDQGPEGLTQAASRAAEVLGKVRDATRRAFLAGRAADRWGQRDPSKITAMQRAIAEEMDRRAPRTSPRRADRDTGFIMQTLSRQSSGPPPWRWALEGELLSLALQEEEWCRRLAPLVEPTDFSPGAHRKIAEVLWASAAGAAPSAPHEIVDSLPEEGGCRARGVELLLAPLPEPQEEVILSGIAKLRKHRGAGGLQEKFEVLAAEEETAEAPGEEEDFAALEARVIAALNSGEMTADHPDVQKYRRLTAKFHGRGQYDFIRPVGPCAGGLGASGQDPFMREEEGS